MAVVLLYIVNTLIFSFSRWRNRLDTSKLVTVPLTSSGGRGREPPDHTAGTRRAPPRTDSHGCTRCSSTSEAVHLTYAETMPNILTTSQIIICLTVLYAVLTILEKQLEFCQMCQ